MTIKRYRSILEMSNPQVIREFQIEDERSVVELMQTIALIHGWRLSDDVAEMGIRSLSRSKHAESSIRQVFMAKSEKSVNYRRISFPCLGFYGEDDQSMIFRIEELGDMDAEGEEDKNEPLLLYAQGLNLLPRMDSLKMWNGLQDQILRRGSSSDYLIGPLKLEQITPDLKAINLRLKLCITQGRGEFIISKDQSRSLRGILDKHTLADLKKMIPYTGLSIPYNIRKADMVSYLVDHFNQPDMWNRILEEMRLEEFECFLRICKGSMKELAGVMPVLKKYCLIEDDYTKVRIPEELIDHYSMLMYAEADIALYYKKRLSLVLKVCRLLYGVFDREHAYRIAEIMFPGGIKEEEFPLYWIPQDDFRLLTPEIMYYSLNLSEKQADNMYRDQEAKGISYYTPNREECFHIAKYGMGFSPNAARVIIPAIRKLQPKRSWYLTKPEDLLVTLYEMYRLGWKDKNIENHLRNIEQWKGSDQAFENLFRVIAGYKGEVRRIRLRGNCEG